MLQRIRDEAHRFANSFHREIRDKRMVSSALDGIPGLGEARKKRIIKAFGGVTAVKKASLEELKIHTWLPEEVALAIFNKFHDS
jgi:excinuclease ABC subunit C